MEFLKIKSLYQNKLGIFYLFFTICFLFLSNKASSQSEMRIDYQAEERSVLQVLKDIEEEYGVRFSYATESIENKKVKLNAKNQLLEDFLKTLLTDLQMDFKIFDQNILLRKNQNYHASNSPTYQKNLHLRGRVTNATATENIVSATIYISNSSIGTYSDEQGNFDIEIPAGFLQEKLMIQFLGYEQKAYRIAELEYEFMLIPLSESPLLIEEILIVNREKPIRSKAFDNSISLTKNQLSDLTAGLAGSDLARQLQLLPGINASNDASADIKIRGSNADETLLILDGMPIYHANHFYGIFSAINTAYLEEVNLYKNIFPIQYGGKTGGVVEMLSANEVSDTFKLNTEVNLLTASLNTAIPISPKSMFYFAGRTTYTDVSNSNFYSFADQQEAVSEVETFRGKVLRFSNNPNFKFNDINAKYALELNAKNNLQLNFYSSADRFSNKYNREAINSGNFQLQLVNEEKESWDNLAANFNYQTIFNEQLALSTNFHYTKYHNAAFSAFNFKGNNPNAISFGYQQNNEIQDLGADIHLTSGQSNRNLKAGISFTRHQILYRFIENDTESLFENTLISEFSPYAEYKFSPLKQLTIQAGIRGTYYEGTGKLYSSPRIMLNYSLSENTYLKTSFASNQQFLRELEYQYRGESKRLWVNAGSQEIPVLQSQNYMMGGLFRFKNLSADVEFYYKDMTGTLEYIVVNPGESVMALNTSRDYQFFTGTGIAKGMDILLSSGYKNYDTYLAYTLSKTTYKMPKIARGKDYPSEDDRRHQLKWINKLVFRQLTFGADWVYTSGRRYINSAKIEEGSNIRDLNPEDLFDDLPAYQRIDLSVTYAFPIKNSRSAIGISLFNALNNNNVKFIQTVVSFDTQNEMTVTPIFGSEANLLNRTFNLSWRLWL
jgi:ferric enterobactin receptor